MLEKYIALLSEETTIYYLAAIVLLLLGIVVVCARIRKSMRKRRGEREILMGKEREIAGAIVDAVEELVFQGIVTRREAKFWYGKFGCCIELPDIVPRNVGKLKREIRMRLKEGGRKPRLPDAKPLNELESLLETIRTSRRVVL